LINWTLLFTAGIIVGTEPYRVKLSSPEQLPFALGLQYWLIVLTCYTITNVAMLCLLSAYLGTLGRRTRIGGVEKNERGHDARAQYTSALMRGFFIYLALVSGLVILTGMSFSNPTQEMYVRLAGTASLISFLAGHNPTLFSRLRTHLDNFINEKTKPGERFEALVTTERTAAAITKE
jgi:hypothetical protein